jgi:hypothetical protein
LHVLGAAPARFLTGTTAKAGWALDRTPPALDLRDRRFGSLDREISEFVKAEGAPVAVIDLQARLPEIFATP